MAAQFSDVVWAIASVTLVQTPLYRPGQLGFSGNPTAPAPGVVELQLHEDLDSEQCCIQVTCRSATGFAVANVERPDDSTIRVNMTLGGSPQASDFDIAVFRTSVAT